MLWNSFTLQGLFEDAKVTNKFLDSHIFNTSCIEINTLFATFNNTELGNFNLKPTHSILQGMDDG